MNIFENLYYLRHNYNSFNNFLQNLGYLDNFFNSGVYWYLSLLVSINDLHLSFNMVNSVSVLFKSVYSYSLLFNSLNFSYLNIISHNWYNLFDFNSNFLNNFLDNGHSDKFVNVLFDNFNNLH